MSGRKLGRGLDMLIRKEGDSGAKKGTGSRRDRRGFRGACGIDAAARGARRMPVR